MNGLLLHYENMSIFWLKIIPNILNLILMILFLLFMKIFQGKVKFISKHQILFA